jgi:hypothetical protein
VNDDVKKQAEEPLNLASQPLAPVQPTAGNASTKFGHQGKPFTVLKMKQRGIKAAAAHEQITTKDQKPVSKSKRKTPTRNKRGLQSSSNLMAATALKESLRHLGYPRQACSKSFKIRLWREELQPPPGSGKKR